MYNLQCHMKIHFLTVYRKCQTTIIIWLIQTAMFDGNFLKHYSVETIRDNFFIIAMKMTTRMQACRIVKMFHDISNNIVQNGLAVRFCYWSKITKLFPSQNSTTTKYTSWQP